jgi:hypothetical protein
MSTFEGEVRTQSDVVEFGANRRLDTYSSPFLMFQCITRFMLHRKQGRALTYARL